MCLQKTNPGPHHRWRGALAAPRPKGAPDAAQTAFSARPPRRAHSGDPRALRRRSNGSDRRDARVARTKSLARRRRGPLDAAHRVAGRRARGRAGARVRRGALAVERPHVGWRAGGRTRAPASCDQNRPCAAARASPAPISFAEPKGTVGAPSLARWQPPRRPGRPLKPRGQIARPAGNMS